MISDFVISGGNTSVRDVKTLPFMRDEIGFDFVSELQKIQHIADLKLTILHLPFFYRSSIIRHTTSPCDSVLILERRMKKLTAVTSTPLAFEACATVFPIGKRNCPM